MRKNQKYTQEDMYAAILRCEQENITHGKFCKESGIHYATFKYWVKKYRKEHSHSTGSTGASFLPVQVVAHKEPPSPNGRITITGGDGVYIECPIDTPESQLSVLIKSL